MAQPSKQQPAWHWNSPTGFSGRDKSREELLTENRLLYLEVLASREAAAITAELVVEQLERMDAIQKSLETANEKLRRLSDLDGLTGIANRRFFDRTLDNEWRRCRRNHVPLSCIMLDIDDFKNFNDTHGHLAGDQCLQLVAGVLQNVIQRSSDTVARYGGEEFIILLPESTPHTAMQAAIKIMVELKKAQRFQPPDRRVTLSQGISTLVPSQNYHPSNLLLQADSALYQAKQEGKDRYMVYGQGVG
jgi:diguanylate cyclase (GGDEF)-like protein